eukprot:GEMP01005955.1.p1 GENE.GEMP01005955.1~~GEMP01005955.1.p1  ORF type:complete len:179 (+),score=36.24 GEMP01005955.1:2-538(+)
MQYCQQPPLVHGPVDPAKEYCILMCRVLVGDAYVTDKVSTIVWNYTPEQRTTKTQRCRQRRKHHRCATHGMWRRYCARPMLLRDQAKPGEEYCMLMCRVLVGDAYRTDKIFLPSFGSQDYLREPPARQSNKRWDSVIAAPGEKKTRDANQPRHQAHYETIIFDRTQIYPEFVIYFKVP